MLDFFLIQIFRVLPLSVVVVVVVTVVVVVVDCSVVVVVVSSAVVATGVVVRTTSSKSGVNVRMQPSAGPKINKTSINRLNMYCIEVGKIGKE